MRAMTALSMALVVNWGGRIVCPGMCRMDIMKEGDEILTEVSACRA